MMKASWAVLLRPSVATFEEFEQDDLRSATLYVLMGEVIAAVLGALSSVIHRFFMDEQTRQFQERYGNNSFFTIASGSHPLVAMGSNLVATMGLFFLYLSLLYLLGRSFGGTGTFGQLCYDTSLYWMPIAVIGALVGVISFGPLRFISTVALLLLVLYNFYLIYLSIRAGMKLPSDKAILIIAILFVLGLVLSCAAVVFQMSSLGVFTFPPKR
jgi:hypothetical protein